MSASSPVPARPRRILMATDLTARCDRALDRAVPLSTQSPVPLHVVHTPPRLAVRARSPADPLAPLRKHMVAALAAEPISTTADTGSPAAEAPGRAGCSGKH